MNSFYDWTSVIPLATSTPNLVQVSLQYIIRGISGLWVHH